MMNRFIGLAYQHIFNALYTIHISVRPDFFFSRKINILYIDKQSTNFMPKTFIDTFMYILAWYKNNERKCHLTAFDALYQELYKYRPLYCVSYSNLPIDNTQHSTFIIPPHMISA